MPIKKHTPEWAKDIDLKEFEEQNEKTIVWSNIYHWRVYRWYSQKELAQKSELTQSIISTLEKWDYNPSLWVLSKIAKALGIPVNILTESKTPWKLLEVMDFVLKKLWNVDTLKLMKIVYFIDYESYNLMEEKLVDISYYRWSWWPFNREIYWADDLYKKDWNNYELTSWFSKYLLLNDFDKKFIEKIINKYWKMDSTQLMKKSYETEPMKWCTIGGTEKMWEKIF